MPHHIAHSCSFIGGVSRPTTHPAYRLHILLDATTEIITLEKMEKQTKVSISKQSIYARDGVS